MNNGNPYDAEAGNEREVDAGCDDADQGSIAIKPASIRNAPMTTRSGD
jgi:hypothetical protein